MRATPPADYHSAPSVPHRGRTYQVTRCVAIVLVVCVSSGIIGWASVMPYTQMYVTYTRDTSDLRCCCEGSDGTNLLIMGAAPHGHAAAPTPTIADGGGGAPPTDTPSTTSAARRGIPNLVHNTWKDANLPTAFARASGSWKSCTKGHTMLWTDEDNRRLIAEKFDWFLEDYDAYRYPIQRVDAARLFILYEYGGIYSDLDIACRNRSYVQLLDYTGVMCATSPVGVSNDLMMFPPKHPFLLQLITALKGSSRKNYVLPYLTVILGGPFWVSYQYLLFKERVEQTCQCINANASACSAENWEHIHIIPPGLTRRYFLYLKGNTWQAWDYSLILLFARLFSHPIKLLIFLFALLCIVWIVLRKCYKSNHPQVKLKA
ncbi:glycosyltransferase family 32 protein [Pelomyxa schiedti]|nr:glycosyltransferase family 32 protein [Pelomyxa schiedti]